MLRQRVLAVDDEEPIQCFYSHFFENSHKGEFVFFSAKDGDRALRTLASETLDIVLLDWILPGLSGMAILKALRAQPKTREIGVVMVSAKSAPGDAAVALESGADDYLSKPFEGRTLLAKICSLVRRKQVPKTERAISEFQGLRWDPESGRLIIENRSVSLSPKESDLLRIFVERPRVLHSLASLWESVWGYESKDWDSIVTIVLHSLKKKLGPEWGEKLETRGGQGYILHDR